MAETPIYFLIRMFPTHMSCIARGVSPLDIPGLHHYSIQRVYPTPSSHDLTEGLILFQQLWRLRRSRQKWRSHPFRLFFREQTGAFPPYPAHLETLGPVKDLMTVQKEGSTLLRTDINPYRFVSS